jgi:tetratricopeptide (TPR) repeat protein
MCISHCSAEFEAVATDLVELGLQVSAGAKDPYLLLRYAEALWIVRDTQAVIEFVDRALAADPPLLPPDQSKAYASRAICQFQEGNLEQALADVCKSIEIFPRGHPYGLRGLIHLTAGNVEAALLDAEESIRLDPQDEETRAFRGMVLLEAGRYQEAIDEFTFVIGTGECEKYLSDLHLKRARALLALGDSAAAEADCTVSMEQNYQEQARWPFVVPYRTKNAHGVYLVRAEARLAQGEKKLALGDCFLAATLAPADPAVYDLRARVYESVGNLPEAMRDLVRAAHLRRADVAEPTVAQPALATAGD